MEVNITDYGATLVSLVVPDRNGKLADVVLGYDTLKDYVAGKYYFGQIYCHRGGFCLETQHFPDSPNQPDFPPMVLDPGSQYEHTTIYKFAVG